MAQPYEVDGDNLYSDSEEYDDIPDRPSSPPPAVPELDSETVPVVRRFASNFPSFRLQPVSGAQAVNAPRPSLARPNLASNPPPGPRIHPDRLANFARNRPAAAPELRRDQQVSTALAEPVKALSRPSAASILPDDDLKDEILAATAKMKRTDAVIRKRPGARKRKLEFTVTKQEMLPLPITEQPSKRPDVGALGHFGDLRSLAAGSLLVPGARKAEDAARQTRLAPQDVYREATLTKKLLEQEARREAEEQARIDEDVILQRKAERQERRMRAQQMRQHRTVAAGMRDNYELERVENYLFGSDKTKDGSLEKNLDLRLKNLGTDAMAEELWTIVIEVI
jgi:hypothetical protein